MEYKTPKEITRVLHIDDEPDYLELTKLYMEDVDPSLIFESATSPDEAMGFLKERGYDCVVCDYKMPGENGLEFFDEVRNFSAIPFILYTARGSEEVAEGAFVKGVTDYVRKEESPSHFQLLARRIRNAVEKHRTEELYRTIVEDNRDAFVIINGLTITYANQAMADILGLGCPEDVMGHTISEFLDEDRKMVERRALSRQRGEPQPRLYEYTVKRADGEHRRLEASVSLVNYSGRPASLVFNHDITEHKKMVEELQHTNEELQFTNAELGKAKKKLKMINEDLKEAVAETRREAQEHRERFNAFMESATDIIAIVDSDLKLIDMNEACLKLFPEGTRKEDLIGEHITQLSPGLEDSQRYKGYLRVSETSEPFTADDYLLDKKFGNKWLRTRVFKVDNDIGFIATDVSESKRASEKMIEAERMATVSRVAAMVAHDLRTPLMIIHQAVTMMEYAPEKSDAMKKLIIDNTGRALEMLEELRTTTNTSTNIMEADLGAIVKESVEGLPLGDSISLELSVGGGLDRVDVDPDKIRRVLDNLIRNAVEAMPDGGRLTVKAERYDGEAHITVSDTGLGIPDTEITKLFTSFHSTKSNGMGLGLAFSKKTVESHGGTINVESKEGEGTTFSVTIPVSHP